MAVEIHNLEGPLLGNTLGRVITEVDLSAPMSDDTFSKITSAFSRNPVLVFRGQSLSAQQLARFARRFGTVRPGVIPRYQHPDTPEISFLTNVGTDGSVDDFGVKRANAWHYDGSFAQHPPILAMLFGVEIPAVGGGTLFADMYRAHATLSAALKSRVRGLTTVNHFGLGPLGADYFGGMTPENWAQYAPVQRPLVMRHRLSGQPYLEFCLIHTAGFTGMTHGEGAELLLELTAHATQPDNVYYHEWRPGDVVVWDEHATLHRNAGDFPPDQRRIMLRAMVDEAR
jgi:taurine dioxygenase